MPTSDRLLARNAVLNVVDLTTSPLVALFAILMLIDALGTDRFGVLTLAWVIIGYFGFFDLGLGRALNKLVAQKLGAGQEQKIPTLVWTGLSMMLLTGLEGTLVLGLQLQTETLHPFYLLVLSIPVVMRTANLRGIPEAQGIYAFSRGARFHGT